jgi:hypothetical protein
MYYKKCDCFLCKDKHEMPNEELPIVKPLLEILALKLSNVSRGQTYDSLMKLLNEIHKKNSLIKHGLSNRMDLVKTHFMDLRSEIQLSTEEAIQQINDLSSKLINDIDLSANELIEYNKSISLDNLDGFNDIVKELELFHTANTDYLKKYEVDEKILLKSSAEAVYLIKKAEKELDDLNSLVFNKKLKVFIKNTTKISESILGEIKFFKSNFSDSIILKDDLEKQKFIKICAFPFDKDRKLIFRASQDGFGCDAFHAKCNEIPNTLIIIKSQNGNVFGGYTEQSWFGHYNFKNDKNAFLFSLINHLNTPYKLKCNDPDKAIYCGSYPPDYYLFEFGCKDLSICTHSNLIKSSYSKLGNSYSKPNYGKDDCLMGPPLADFLLLAGSENFLVEEIEVFTKI